jgi:methionine-rich copper-binding protein CopC
MAWSRSSVSLARAKASRVLSRASRNGRRHRGRSLRYLAIPMGLVTAGALLVVSPATAAHAACGNPVVCENQQTGTPQATWDVPNPSTSIVGFADPFSVAVGGTINFKIKTSAATFTIDIYRIGYYGGDGARKITSLTPDLLASQNQPACSTNTTTGLVDCGNWSVSATWNVPSTAVSGVYFARITSSSGANQIPFVVRDDSSHADIVMMTSDETWQAYNDYGGGDFYVGSSTGSPWCCSALDPGRSVQISYNRPFSTRDDTPFGQDYFFNSEYPLIRFMEQNGYDVSYVSQSDVAQSGGATMLEQHKMFTVAGHSEYFDASDRNNITAARDAGVNLAFFSGNLMWWKTRWANSQFGNEPFRTLITYKESLDSTQSDPSDPPTWTGAWRDTRFSPPGDASPENSLTGQLWDVNCCSYAETVPAAYAKLQIWKHTAVASLASGQTYTMPDETLGYEWDSDIDNGSRPAGEIDMSQTCATVQQKLATDREELVSDNACNSLTLYRASSGALVFDAGTIQWTWGLDSNHDGDVQNPPDPAMQQATVNLFADMGVQPATLMSGLVAGVQPHYTAAPTTTITSPSSGASFGNGSTVTVSGTAADSGGGVVSAVEVSTNGGSTWHPATAMSAAGTSVTWSYTWGAAGNGSVTIEARASDDAANLGAASQSVSVTVGCPCSLFSANHVPFTTSAGDVNAYELGMKFQSTVPGWVAGVRFYKGSGNGGTHTGSLWTASGTLLATGTFINETSSGWQTLTFASPVQISANTTYVVSYYDPEGHYAVDEEYFVNQVNTPPLIGVKANYLQTGGGNGVFNAGGPGFPTQTGDSWSYSVDVVFDTVQPPSHPAVNSVTPVVGSSSNPVSTDPTVTFSEAVQPSSVSLTVKDQNGNTVPGSVSLDGTDTVATFTPSSSLAAGTTFTVTVSGAKDNNGETLLNPYTYTFTTSKTFDAGGKCPCAIWPDVVPPGVADSNDQSSGVELGVKFTASQNGSITGIRFYRTADDLGTHTGTLWSSTGTQLATGTFTNEPSQGWEELDFSSPVPITAGTTYVASYHSTAWHYAYVSNGLASAVTSGPLTALANGGVYAYGTSSTFPTNTFNSTNYWVDVVYTTSSGSFSPTVTSVTPTDSSQGNPVSVAPTVTFSQAVVPSTVSFTVKDSGGNTVAGKVTMDSTNTVATFTPNSALAGDTTYTATVSGAQNSFGTPMSSPFSWTFTTAGTQCPCSIWPGSAQPSVASASDPGPVNLGVQFTASANGWITGIRFYKGSANTGTHVGSLWTSSGTLLGQVTFTNESASGWQEADFATPIAVTAGTTYVASYYAPHGGYSYDSAAFANAGVTNGPLTALQSSAASPGNGVYVYGSSPAFPNSTYNATNYWVDVVFTEP